LTKVISSAADHLLCSLLRRRLPETVQGQADFTTRWTYTEAERSYARFVSTITHQDKPPPFDRAVARGRYGSRWRRSDKLSTRFGEIYPIREA
jgi:hypothetical protein